MLTVGAARIMEVYVDAIRRRQQPNHTIAINEPGPLTQFKRHPLRASAFPPRGNASYMQPSDNYQPAVYKVTGGGTGRTAAARSAALRAPSAQT